MSRKGGKKQKKKKNQTKKEKRFKLAGMGVHDDDKRNKVDLIRAWNHEIEFRTREGFHDCYIYIGDAISEGEIYVGNISSSFTKSVMKHGFTHIIHCIEVPKNMNKKKRESGELKELNVFFEDEYKVELWNSILSECFKFIDDAFEENKKAKVLIHCFSGMSRSVSICCGYFMWKRKWRYNESINAIRMDRNCASPQGSFMPQLLLFEKNDFKIDDELKKICRLYCTRKLKGLNPYDMLGDGEEKAKKKKSAKDEGRKCIVCGKVPKSLKCCAGCKKVFYCGRTCQLKHWKAHKKFCKKNRSKK